MDEAAAGMRDREPRYRVLRELGRGGMGAVFLAVDAVRQEEVALKRISAVSAQAMLRFKREFRAVERLRHPNLVRLYELGEDEHGLYYTMEAIDGVDLLAYCTGGSARPGGATQDGLDPSAPTAVARAGSVAARRPARPADPARLAHALPQVIEALAFLHGRGIVHRDLKPSNVMVAGDGVVKLLDFGVLGELGAAARGREQGEVVGTLGYMAPEQISAEGLTPACDLYALGAMLFEIVAGRPVFEGEVASVVARHLDEGPPLLSDVAPGAPPALVEACAALLRKSPADRPPLARLAATLLPPLGARAAVLPAARAPAPPLVGRDAAQDRLRRHVERARAGEFALLALSGPTGAGKTALADWIAGEAERDGLAVLRGSGRATERVAFNEARAALDRGLAIAAAAADWKAPALDRGLAIAAAAADWKAPALDEVCRAAAKEAGVKEGDFFMVLRVAVTGKRISPPLFETMEVLGRDETLARLTAARGKL